MELREAVGEILGLYAECERAGQATMLAPASLARRVTCARATLKAAYEASEPEAAEDEFVEVPVRPTRDGEPWLQMEFPSGRARYLVDAPNMPDFCGYVYETEEDGRWLGEQPRKIETCGMDGAKVAMIPVAVLFRKRADGCKCC